MAEKTLNPQTLNESARVYLEGILSKTVQDLTVYDIGFLRARSVYLTADQREYFADALNGKFKGMDYVEKDTIEVEQPDIFIEVDANGNKTINPEKVGGKVLIQMCKDAGISFDPHASKKVLADLLNAFWAKK